MKLSPRALVLLQLVADYTKPIDLGGGKKGESFFFPNHKSMYSPTFKETVYVDGAGDASALKGLERKGFVEKASKDWKYAYRITAEGRRELEGRKS